MVRSDVDGGSVTDTDVVKKNKIRLLVVLVHFWPVLRDGQCSPCIQINLDFWDPAFWPVTGRRCRDDTNVRTSLVHTKNDITDIADAGGPTVEARTLRQANPSPVQVPLGNSRSIVPEDGSSGAFVGTLYLSLLN